MGTTLRRAWRGEIALWKIWWLVGMPWVILFVSLEGFVRRATGLSSSAIDIVAFVMVAGEILWMSVAWQCAPNVKHRVWMYLARTYILLRLAALCRDFVTGLLA